MSDAASLAPATPKSPVVPAPMPRTRPADVKRETGFALIVDDEMFVREVAASSLEEMGFQTLVADSGEAGLELFRQRRADVRVAVIDLVMPAMGGGPCEWVRPSIRRFSPGLGWTVRPAIRRKRAPGIGASSTSTPSKPVRGISA